jgi:putative ABC transport system permease protein
VRGLPLLVLRRLAHDWAQTALLTACLAGALLIPIAGRMVLERTGAELRRRAAETPLVVGVAGSPIELVLASLYFDRAEIGTLRYRETLELDAEPEVLAVPLALGFTTRGAPIVGTRYDYFEQRDLRPARGNLLQRLGDCVVGAALARRLGIAPGDGLFSDPREAYDLATAPPLRMHVRGVLETSGTADDEAVFVDLRTAWLLEGLLHGHAEARSLPERVVLGRDGERIVLDEGIREYYEVTDENLAGFHLHGELGEMPTSAILVFPRTRKAATIVSTRLDEPEARQAVDPAIVVGDLLNRVVRVARIFDLVTVVLVVVTVALSSMTLLLSIRARRSELLAMRAIGAGPWTIRLLIGGEVLAVVAVAVVVALVAAAWLDAVVPDLVRWVRSA